MISDTQNSKSYSSEVVIDVNSKKLAAIIERNFHSTHGAAEVGWGDGLLVFRAGDDKDHLSTPFTKVNGQAQKLVLEVEFCSPPERCKNSIIQVQDHRFRTVAFLNGEDFVGKKITYPIDLDLPNSSIRMVFPGATNLFLALPRRVRVIPNKTQ